VTYGELRFNASQLPEAQGVNPDRLEVLLNGRLQKILGYMPWKHLEASGGFLTVAAIGAGLTAAVTPGLSIATIAGGTVPLTVQGMQFRILYRFETYNLTYMDPTHVTLDRPYEGDTADTAAAFWIFQDRYALPDDYAEPVDALNEHLPMQLVYMDQSTLNHSAPSRVVFGEPQIYSPLPDVIDDAGNITQFAEVYPIPMTAEWVPFRYVRRVAPFDDTNTATVWPAWISSSAILYGVQADLGNKNQESMYRELLASMVRTDSKLRGPQAMKMHPAFTRHRVQRVLQITPRLHLP